MKQTNSSSNKFQEYQDQDNNQYQNEDDQDSIGIVGAVKLMDGIFLGDAICEKLDAEFLRCNKITYILNCAGDQIDNYFQDHMEYKYFTLHWKEFKPNELSQKTTNSIYDFSSEALPDYQGLLIRSLNGKNRCVVAALIIFMQLIRWGLIKALEFMNSNKPGLEMTPSIFKKLLQFETILETDFIKMLNKDSETLF